MRDIREALMKCGGASEGTAPFWRGEARLLEGGGPCRVGPVDHERGCRME